MRQIRRGSQLAPGEGGSLSLDGVGANQRVLTQPLLWMISKSVDAVSCGLDPMIANSTNYEGELSTVSGWGNDATGREVQKHSR